MIYFKKFPLETLLLEVIINCLICVRLVWFLSPSLIYPPLTLQYIFIDIYSKPTLILKIRKEQVRVVTGPGILFYR